MGPVNQLMHVFFLFSYTTTAKIRHIPNVRLFSCLHCYYSVGCCSDWNIFLCWCFASRSSCPIAEQRKVFRKTGLYTLPNRNRLEQRFVYSFWIHRFKTRIIASLLAGGGLLGTNPPSPTSSTFFKSTITFLCPQPLQIILLLISLSLSLPQNDIGHATVLWTKTKGFLHPRPIGCPGP